MDIQKDVDPQETREWLDALSAVLAVEGPDRAHFLIEQLIDTARRSGAYMPFSANTAYINTIPVDKQVRIPGDQSIEHKIRSYVRWNAMAMVLRANKHTNVGGHIASFASAATLYDVGFNHFWHAPSENHGGDLVFVQGHSATGVYARAYMLGRFTTEQMDHFRHGVARKARQPDTRRQLQPAPARRPGTQQWQGHPGTRKRLSRRRLECDQGHLGHALGRALGARQERHSRAAHDGMRRWRIPDVQ